MGTRTRNVSSAGRNAAAGSAGRGTSHPNASAQFFGVPIGDLGWFASLLMGTATGFAAFFAATFAGIAGIMVYNSSGRQQVDYAYSYTRVGLPVGVLVLVVALGYLGTLWVKRQLKHR